MSASETIPDRFRTAVTANAAFCTVSGVAIALLYGRLPGVLGAGDPGLYLSLGAFLAVYGVHLFFSARRDGLRRIEGWLIVAGDVAWVLGSVAIVAAGLLSSLGVTLVLAVAAVVGAFALWQGAALRGGAGTTPARSTG